MYYISAAWFNEYRMHRFKSTKKPYIRWNENLNSNSTSTTESIFELINFINDKKYYVYNWSIDTIVVCQNHENVKKKNAKIQFKEREKTILDKVLEKSVVNS